MSSSKTSTGIDSINIFTGIDYHVWAERMKSYLLHIGSWSIINLSFPKPSSPADTATAAVIAEYRKELREWQKLNDSGLGPYVSKCQTLLGDTLLLRTIFLQRGLHYRPAIIKPLQC